MEGRKRGEGREEREFLKKERKETRKAVPQVQVLALSLKIFLTISLALANSQ